MVFRDAAPFETFPWLSDPPQTHNFPTRRMLTTRRLSLYAALILAATGLAPHTARAQSTSAGSEKIDYATLARIKDEGLQRSQVMDHISWIADVYGPRLTGGPGIRQAADWTKKKFGEWGLSGIHEEPWAFGKGWQLVRFHAHMDWGVSFGPDSNSCRSLCPEARIFT